MPMARSRFCSCERSSLQLTITPLGKKANIAHRYSCAQESSGIVQPCGRSI
jgi:hypothetical protein